MSREDLVSELRVLGHIWKVLGTYIDWIYNCPSMKKIIEIVTNGIGDRESMDELREMRWVMMKFVCSCSEFLPTNIMFENLSPSEENALKRLKKELPKNKINYLIIRKCANCGKTNQLKEGQTVDDAQKNV